MNKDPKHCTDSHNKSAPVASAAVGSADDVEDVLPAADAAVVVVVCADVLTGGSFLDAGRVKAKSYNNMWLCGEVTQELYQITH